MDHRTSTTILLGSFLLLAAAGGTAAVAGTPVSLEGQVACSQCWFEADRARVAYGTEGDLACARRCAGAGVAPALAVRSEEDGAFELVVLDGPAPDGVPWVERMGRFVRVEGDAGHADGRRTLRVAAVEDLDASPWPAPGPIAKEPAGPATLAWTDLSGRPFALEGLRGQVVVLNFWATWCAPCLRELPDLSKVQDAYALHGVRVVGAAADPPAAGGDVAEFAREREVRFPVVLGADVSQMEALGLRGALPATVVLDRDGRVVERFEGVVERRALEDAIDRALEGAAHHEGHGAGPEARSGAADAVRVAAARPGEASLVPS